MRPTKALLLDALPLREGELTLRAWRREDLDLLARWPGYPTPYEALNLRFGTMTPSELDGLFEERQREQRRIVLIADHADGPAIGYFALVEIDWEAAVVGSMSIRLRPDWCDRGIGRALLRMIAGWCFSSGISAIRLDVASPNTRAVRCYERAGFVKTGEFRSEGSGVTHYWMELRCGQSARA